MNERGSGTLLMIAVLMVTLTLALGVAIGAAYVVLAHRARTAADLAALSGAEARHWGEDACAEARRTAIANATVLQRCRAVGDQTDFVVEVEVTVAVPRAWPGLPRALTTTASAGVLQP